MTRPLAAKHVKANRKYHADLKAKKEAEGWEFHDQYHGATLPLVRGRRFRRVGKSGWYKFLRYIISPNGSETIECFGPFTQKGAPKKGCGFGACYPDAVIKVARRVVHKHDERVNSLLASRKKKAT